MMTSFFTPPLPKTVSYHGHTLALRNVKASIRVFVHRAQKKEVFAHGKAAAGQQSPIRSSLHSQCEICVNEVRSSPKYKSEAKQSSPTFNKRC